ncbi:hypothetical protein JTB14_016841, partial [Gonioctena quinquepunctata]
DMEIQEIITSGISQDIFQNSLRTPETGHMLNEVENHNSDYSYQQVKESGLGKEENHGIYENRPILTGPATIRIGELMSELEEEPPETYNLGVYEVAPWEIKPPVIRFDCLKYKKDEAPRQLIYGKIRSIRQIS